MLPGEDDILELRYMTLDSDEQKVMQSIIDSWDDMNKLLLASSRTLRHAF